MKNQPTLSDVREEQRALARSICGEEVEKSLKGGEGLGRVAAPMAKPGRRVSPALAEFCGALCVKSLPPSLQADLATSLVNDAEIVLGEYLERERCKTGLTSSDIAMPTEFLIELTDLISEYGVGRRWCTVQPVATGTVKLPKMTTRPAVGFVDQSTEWPEVSPQVEYVTFSPKKSGAMLRVPAEIMTDLQVPGTWFARYFTNALALWEDTVLFLADGTADYRTIKGVCVKADELLKRVVLADAKTHPSDMTLTSLRALRGQVDAAARNKAAYFMHRTHETFLAGLNSDGDKPYLPNGAVGPSLDGYPVVFTDVLPEYDASAHTNQYQVVFGDLRFWWIALRQEFNIGMATQVKGLFERDEIAVLGSERFDIGLMADGAAAVLKLAAA